MQDLDFKQFVDFWEIWFLRNNSQPSCIVYSTFWIIDAVSHLWQQCQVCILKTTFVVSLYDETCFLEIGLYEFLLNIANREFITIRIKVYIKYYEKCGYISNIYKRFDSLHLLSIIDMLRSQKGLSPFYYICVLNLYVT